ncbi:MAG: hypothetical protein KatS3mg022_1343 [Armatimonadota bacterium]|nr:MAG: hypothetical protein KatS3mg022_1343 [Armatimonadota bacterium]
MELSYNQVYHMNPIEARKQIVHTYLQTGSISHTAKVWNTSQQVVHKWVQHYQPQGEAGMHNRRVPPPRR